MNELDHCRKLLMIRAAVAQRASREQDQCRTQSFAAALDDVLGDLPNQSDIGMQALTDYRVNRLHVRLDQVVELLHSHDTAPWHKTAES